MTAPLSADERREIRQLDDRRERAYEAWVVWSDHPAGISHAEQVDLIKSHNDLLVALTRAVLS